MVQITASPSQLLIASSIERGLFSFLEQKSASKSLKRAILHTFQASGGARDPRSPPGYATAGNYGPQTKRAKKCCQSYFKIAPNCSSTRSEDEFLFANFSAPPNFG